MGLFDFFKRLLFGGPAEDSAAGASVLRPFVQTDSTSPPGVGPRPISASHKPGRYARRDADRAKTRDEPKPRLQPLRYQSSLVKTSPSQEVVDQKPYRFGTPAGYGKRFLDLSKDGDLRWLEYYGLPPLHTPDELAQWLGLPIGKLAWLAHRTRDGKRPQDARQSHYFYQFHRKRTGGYRLIEAPKKELLRVQQQVLREILDHVPDHPAAHGFVQGRSIITNARPHVGKRFILKLDLQDFYPSVKYARVVAIFRSLGFSREVSLWLAQLTTTSIPWDLKLPTPGAGDRFEHWQFMSIYHPRHLPQGAPTSPALANLSAFALDVRLSGLATAYRLTYTRYADDLTFSGEGRNIPALRQFIPLAMQVVKAERFRVNLRKRKVIRSSGRQTVTGVVVNEKLNVSRKEYDRLKAILTNCARHGPSSQNRDQHEHFAHHLRGRIAHVTQLNRVKGEKLLAIFNRIDWSK